MSTLSAEDQDLIDRWRRLETLDVLGDHWWWRPGWRVGRSFYTWHVTFEDDPTVADLAADWQAGLNLPGLDLVPADGLHLTMQGVGFTDDIDPTELSRIIDAARTRFSGLAPFTLALGPADADPEGIPLAVRPWHPVQHLRTTLREAIADVWGTGHVPEAADGFRPHVTLAYSSGGTPATDVRERLAALRKSITPIEVIVRAASLIRLNRDEKHYRWTTEATIPLAATGRVGHGNHA
ncbi:MAG: 2'-5' RNA ligase family protein [Actinobacteria bacterium]|nr:2'-5' RNA ligase family protein [Actinomycetota bacterium]MBI3686666.1 2'-5' RNA ligase family protein [Actinomycetota bacterium]